MTRFCVMLVLLSLTMLLSGRMTGQPQNCSLSMSLQDAISEILQDVEEENDMEASAAQLLELADHPVKINVAAQEEWLKLFWLSVFQIQSIRSYIQTYGSLSSCSELFYIPGISSHDVLLLLPFVSFDTQVVHKKLSMEGMLNEGRYQWLLRSQFILEKQVGYQQAGTRHFTGGPLKILTRFSGQLEDNIHIGYTAEKDPGEPFFCRSNPGGFDFNSFHVEVNTPGFIKTVILGDYQVNLGQGLICGSGYYLGKSALVMSGLRHSSSLSHYQVTDENKFNRGLAVKLGGRVLSLTIWGSRHGVDANIVRRDSVTNRVMEVSSLQTTGIHAISSEIEDEDALHQSIVGAHIGFEVMNFSGGVSVLVNDFDALLNPLRKPYNLYYFRGTRNMNASFDFQTHLQRLIIFGEEGVSKNGGYALLNGFQSYINSRLSCSIISRWYQPSFQSISGRAFGENAMCSNEYGLFMGFELVPFKYTTTTIYLDVFRFPWLKYGIDIPSAGHEFLMQTTVIPSPAWRFTLQYRNKMKQDLGGDSVISGSKTVNKSSDRLRLNIIHSPDAIIKFNVRLEYSRLSEVSGKSLNGFYVGQDVSFKWPKRSVELSGHLAWFRTDSSAVSIYAYEPDMLYSNTIPVMSHRGYRAFLMVQYRLGKKWFFWIKYDATVYLNRNTIGSDLFLIHGNKKSEIKFQLLKKF